MTVVRARRAKTRGAMTRVLAPAAQMQNVEWLTMPRFVSASTGSLETHFPDATLCKVSRDTMDALMQALI